MTDPSLPNPPETATSQSTAGVPLERFLIAMQKSLSRVSRDSATVPAGAARSLIVGEVGFDAELRADMADADRILITPTGGVRLRLSGRLATDVGVRIADEPPATGSDGPPQQP